MFDKFHDKSRMMGGFGSHRGVANSNAFKSVHIWHSRKSDAVGRHKRNFANDRQSGELDRVLGCMCFSISICCKCNQLNDQSPLKTFSKALYMPIVPWPGLLLLF